MTMLPARKRRYTGDDSHFGPFTWGPSGSWRPFRLVYSTGGSYDSGAIDNHLIFYAFGKVLVIGMPNIMQPYQEKHMATTWDAATVARMGRDYYFETFAREYGFSLSEDGFFQLFLGRQTHDSSTTQSWSYNLPWKQWRFARHSLYDPLGAPFWTQLESERKGLTRPELWALGDLMRDKEAEVPKAAFWLRDFDGTQVMATCHIEEREWHFGQGWFKWLSWFRKPKIRRSLAIEFSHETGPEKGSWKGGTTGCGIDMLPGELPLSAIKRFCEQDHRSKYNKYKMQFIGPVLSAS